jgi:hypothetical protein
MEEMTQRGVRELLEQHAAKQEQRAARQLARNQRMSGAPVALTEEDLEAMRAPADDAVYGNGKGLTKRCQNMLERSQDPFPGISPTIQWKRGHTRSQNGGPG